jgi:hypothetical protein
LGLSTKDYPYSAISRQPWHDPLHEGARGDREIGLFAIVGEGQTDGVLGLDLVLFATVQIGYDPDQPGVALKPGLDRPRAQSVSGMRRQHADADTLDDSPDAIKMILLAHEQVTYEAAVWLPEARIRPAAPPAPA